MWEPANFPDCNLKDNGKKSQISSGTTDYSQKHPKLSVFGMNDIVTLGEKLHQIMSNTHKKSHRDLALCCKVTAVSAKVIVHRKSDINGKFC